MNLMDVLNKHNIRTVEIAEETAKLTDEVALTVIRLFPAWQTDHAYAVDERIRYGGKLYRCVQSHTSQSEWTPDVTPALWTEVAMPDEILVWKRPTGVQDAYNYGDKVYYPTENDDIYQSIYDGKNSWSPDEYPAGWMKLT